MTHAQRSFGFIAAEPAVDEKQRDHDEDGHSGARMQLREQAAKAMNQRQHGHGGNSSSTQMIADVISARLF